MRFLKGSYDLQNIVLIGLQQQLPSEVVRRIIRAHRAGAALGRNVPGRDVRKIVRDPAFDWGPQPDGNSGANGDGSPGRAGAPRRLPPFPESKLRPGDEIEGLSPQQWMSLLSTPHPEGPSIAGPFPIDVGGGIKKRESFLIWVNADRIVGWMPASQIPRACRRGEWVLWSDGDVLQVAKDRQTDAGAIRDENYVRRGILLSEQDVKTRQAASADQNRDMEHFVASGASISHAMRQVQSVHQDMLTQMVQGSFQIFAMWAAMPGIESQLGEAGEALHGIPKAAKDMRKAKGAESKGTAAQEESHEADHSAHAKQVIAEKGISEVEKLLLAEGMTPEELELYKGTLNRDQQAALDIDTRIAQRVKPSASMDIEGNVRQKAEPKQLAAAVKANLILYEHVQPGVAAIKVVPEGQLGEFLAGMNKYGQVGLRGDFALAQNSEGMNAPQKAEYLGLDYSLNEFGDGPYTQIGADGRLELRPQVREAIYQIEARLTAEHAEKAKVPLGHDLYEALVIEANRMARAKAEEPSARVPRLLELTSDGDLKHAIRRFRKSGHDPSTGFGYTASMGLRDRDGKQFFQANQELNFETTTRLPVGTQLVRIGKNGEKIAIATWDGERFAIESSLAPGERAYYGQKLAEQQASLEKLKGKKP
jgi:hypothetical protein